MLLPDITTGTQRAILAGLAWQQQLSSESLESSHILLGLLHEDEGTIATLFLAQHISLADVLISLGIEAREITLAEELPIVLPSPMPKLLYQARLLALDQMGAPLVHTQHLLQSLLEAYPTLKESLIALGMNIDQFVTPNSETLLPIRFDEPLHINDSEDKQSLARIIDANANRAREALRVLEELARFHLNDTFTTRLAKELRHTLTQLLQQHLPASLLLSSRDTEYDVGTRISTSTEEYRHSLQAVLHANAQRLQEALRSLEEYGKVISSSLGKQLEKLRYQSYTLQRALFSNHQARQRLVTAQLYLLVSKASCAASLEWTIREAAAGGVDIVQLREKQKTDRELLAIGREVRAVTREVGVLFIMNDRPDLSRLLHADGVHLGQDDVNVSAARQFLGSDAIIGVSTHHQTQLEQAIRDGADYLGVGPTFPSNTKSFDTFAGLEYVRQVASTTSLPAFAIGGITSENVSSVVAAGLRRVAIGQAITQADDPRMVAGQIKDTLTSP